LNFFDHLWVAHARHTAIASNVKGNTLQRHYRYGTGVFGNPSLLGVHDVHDDAPTKHVCEAALDAGSTY
jgi:hypothetical protein